MAFICLISSCSTVIFFVLPSASVSVISKGPGVPSESLILTIWVCLSKKSIVMYASFWKMRCLRMFFIEMRLAVG